MDAQRSLIRNRRGLRAILGLLPACVISCSPQSPDLPAADNSSPEVLLLSPAEGALVADTVAVIIDARDDQGVARVTLLVDGRGAAVCYTPPWTIAWPTGALADSSLHHLQAEAVDQAGNLGLSPERRVWVRRNAAPRVTILWPADELWINAAELGRTPWRCAADDPDEGPLPAERIRWFLDGNLLEGGDLTLLPPPLPPGSHTLTVRAADRWGRVGTARQRFTVFNDPPETDPAGALDAFLCALRARRGDRAADLLAPGFVQLPPQSAVPRERWTRDAAMRALTALAGDSCLTRLTLDGRIGRPTAFSWNGRPLAKIEIRAWSVQAPRACPGSGRGNGPTMERERVVDSAARVFLCAAESGGGQPQWRLLTWWDLHGSCWSGLRAPSWTDLLRSRLFP